MKVLTFVTAMLISSFSFAGEYDATCKDGNTNVQMQQSADVYLYVQGYSPEDVQTPDDGFVRTKSTVIYNTKDYYGQGTEVTSQVEITYSYKDYEAIVITPVFGDEPGEPVLQMYKAGKMVADMECTYDEH